MSLSAATRLMSEAREKLCAPLTRERTSVFLSYARSDLTHIEALAQFIEANGYTVWWDNRIEAGEYFDDCIATALDASFAVVVLWSKNSTGSRWVNWEARRGLSQNKLVPLAAPELKYEDLWPPFGDLNTLRLVDRDRLLVKLQRLAWKDATGRAGT